MLANEQETEIFNTRDEAARSQGNKARERALCFVLVKVMG